MKTKGVGNYLNYIGPVETDAKIVDNIETLILTTN